MKSIQTFYFSFFFFTTTMLESHTRYCTSRIAPNARRRSTSSRIIIARSEPTFAASELQACVRAQYSKYDMPSRETPSKCHKSTKQKRLGCSSGVGAIVLCLQQIILNQPKRIAQDWKNRRIPFRAAQSLQLLCLLVPRTVIVISPLVFQFRPYPSILPWLKRIVLL